MDLRYINNIDKEIFTEETQNILLTKTLAVIGCGGSGGYILEFLTRLGVKSLHFWDGDNFSESNLNRQYGSSMATLNQNKATVMYNKLKEINPTIDMHAYPYFCGMDTNDFNILKNCDMIIMACDESYNILKVRSQIRHLILSGIPVVDEAVLFLGGWVSIVTQNDLGLYDAITQGWLNKNNDIINNYCSRPAYKCAIIAAETVNQVVQYFSNNRYAMVDSKLTIDIFHHRYYQSDKTGNF